MARYIKKTNFDYILQNAALAMGFLSDEEINNAFTATRATLEEAVIGALRQAISELKPLSFVKTKSVDELHGVDDTNVDTFNRVLYEAPEDFVEVHAVYNGSTRERETLPFELLNENLALDVQATTLQYFYSPNNEKSLNAIENADGLFLRVAAHYVAMIILPVVNPMMRDDVYIALQQAKGDYSARNKSLSVNNVKSDFQVFIDNKNVNNVSVGNGGYGGRHFNGWRFR